MNDPDNISLVIFDCDGVLVDTEKFYVELLLEFAAPYGLKIPLEEAMRLFVGVTLRRCMSMIEDICSKKLVPDFFQQFADAFAKRIEYSITPIEGIEGALNNIQLPICVASNSSMSSLKQMLSLVDLYKYFEDRIFSAYDLKKWKPEPDIFLKAADEMKVDPKRCLVIEDSVVGVQAAQAAGMHVFAYVGSEHASKELLCCGVLTFKHMGELPKLIQSLSKPNLITA